jgi:putative glutamine amidotransferase
MASLLLLVAVKLFFKKFKMLQNANSIVVKKSSGQYRKTPFPVRRIGLTMRISSSQQYDEKRDAIAHHWHDFMSFALPEVSWIPIPNLSDDAVEYFKTWKLSGLIITGGNDVGSSLERDSTEKALLEYALHKNFPVFGVCRGHQFINTYFGGELSQCSEQEHVATEHFVHFVDRSDEFALGAKKVNSYHSFAVPISGLSSVLSPLAIANGQLVEALAAKEHPLIAVQWHPERNLPFNKFDKQLIRSLFKTDTLY